MYDRQRILSGEAAPSVIRVSPQQIGLAGVVHCGAAEPVPIANLLTHVLARYGLPADEKARPFADLRDEQGVAELASSS